MNYRVTTTTHSGVKEREEFEKRKDGEKFIRDCIANAYEDIWTIAMEDNETGLTVTMYVNTGLDGKFPT